MLVSCVCVFCFVIFKEKQTKPALLSFVIFVRYLKILKYQSSGPPDLNILRYFIFVSILTVIYIFPCLFGGSG